MDKKFLIKTILLNTAWVMWIVFSVFLGYIIYREAFPRQPIVIIPFSLLFLVVGGVVAYFANKLFKKKRCAKMADIMTDIQTGTEPSESTPTLCTDKSAQLLDGENDINTEKME